VVSIIGPRNNLAARPRRRRKGELSSVAKQSSAFDYRGVRVFDAMRARAADERAQTMTEYAVLLTLITLAVLLAVTDLANLLK
jgi:Flp pilus assembly pilin Flp